MPQILSVHDIPISVKEFLSFKDDSNIDNALTSVGFDGKTILNKSLDVLSGG